MLKINNVHAAYGSVVALRGVSLVVNPGEIVCLLGANGAGKSTTLRLISGLLHPQQGDIQYCGKPIHHLAPEAIARLGIAHVPEGRRIFPGLTVRENLILGASNRPKVKKAELESDITKMFEIFPDLQRLRDALGWTLSGGQQQMLAIGRGLMARPQLLLMDEPSLGLAPIIVQQVFAVVKQINESMGTTVLVVEQNASIALTIASRGYVMETGKIVVEGKSSDLLNSPEVREAYLGGRRSS